MVDALVVVMFFAWMAIVALRVTRWLQWKEAQKYAEARRPRRRARGESLRPQDEPVATPFDVVHRAVGTARVTASDLEVVRLEPGVVAKE